MSLKLRIYYNAVFGSIGGLLAWYLLGQFGAFHSVILRDVTAGVCIGSLIGGLMGCIDGLFDKSLFKIGRGSFYGAWYGLLGGMIGLLIGELILWYMGEGILGRAFGWLCLGLAVGRSEGVANKARRKISYGAIGGSAGGFLGGAIFEFLRSSFGSYAFSQALGLVVLGACIGSLIGLAEDILRDAWLMVIHGRQEGKEFTLAKDKVTIGSDERCDVALFHDDKIKARHAQIVRQKGQSVLQGFPGSQERALVNAKPVVSSHVLQDRDQVTIGNTRLLFRLKPKGAVRVL